MRHIHINYLAAACFAAACLDAVADEGFLDAYRRAATAGQTSHAVEIDNDTLLLNKNDGFFTSGMRYTQRHTLTDAQTLTSYGWRIGQDLYTASDIKVPAEFIGPPDHPYAGWLYGGLFKETHRADGSFVRWGLDVGCLGPCAGGEWTQKNFHRVISQPQPQGWSKQVKNEVGAVLQGSIAPVRWTPQSWFDVIPYLSGRFGNIFTDAGGGVTLRVGRLNLLPNQPTLHGYVRTDVRAVGYNATLQGGYFSKDNPHTVTPKRWVGEAEAGLAWISGPYSAVASLVRRSNEIRDLPNGLGAQNYLHLLFAYTP